jgi:catechol 2,3-dioxygenase-like lactoylglutathione lyase family enzyme
MKAFTLILTTVTLWPVTACWAQVSFSRAEILRHLMVLAPNEAGVSMGHWYTIVRDVDAARQFWTLLGGTPTNVDGTDAMKFHGVLIFLQKGEPSGGTVGTAVDHIGLRVRDGDAFVGKLKAAGVKADPDFGERNHQAMGLGYTFTRESLGYVHSPDGVKVEIMEDKNLPLSVVCDHIHFSVPLPVIPEMQAWYANTFAAAAYVDNVTSPFNPSASADIPGVRLKWPSFSAPSSRRLPTKGRALDHIGFEVRNLEAFCEKLRTMGVKFDQPFSKTRHASYASAELTDPWGASIELTEGLRP